MEQGSSPQDEATVFQKSLVKKNPPKIRFDDALHAQAATTHSSLDHFEFMMVMMELHPVVPFEDCSYGSDLLDNRRALSYQIFQRQLGHCRSLVANANIRNRVGVGVSLRAMLEMYAFANFFHDKDRLQDEKLLNRFLHGQAFTPGGWYELESFWQDKHGKPLPEYVKELVKSRWGLPRVNAITKSTHDADEGFAYLYSRYSEFVHPAFERLRVDTEDALGSIDPPLRGSAKFYKEEIQNGSPTSLILTDIATAGFCLELFWPVALHIDPHFDEHLRPSVVEVLEKYDAANVKKGRR